MSPGLIRGTSLIAVAALLLLGAGLSGASMSDDRPALSALGAARIPITPNDLKPSACAGIAVTDLVTGSGDITGTSGNNLILGSAGDDIIHGGPANNCIVAGAGYNVCYGSAGVNVFLDCQEIH